MSPSRLYEGYLPFFDFVAGFACANAEAATDFVRSDVRPSRRSADASLAISAEVCLRFVLAIGSHLLSRLDSFFAFAKKNTPKAERTAMMFVGDLSIRLPDTSRVAHRRFGSGWETMRCDELR